MSPEQALAKHGLVDHRTDIYSLGVTLYELLTLRPALVGEASAEILRRVVEEEPPALRSLNRALPCDLETIVLKAMAKEPSERYASAGEVAKDLRRWLADQPIQAKRISRGPGLARCRRNRIVAGLTATALVLLALVAAVAAAGYVSTAAALGREEGHARRPNGSGMPPPTSSTWLTCSVPQSSWRLWT